MADTLPDELQRAEKEGLAYTDLLLRLVRAQWHHRQETALEWRIRQARLPERWALETFPFQDQPGVNKRQIMSLAELDFIPTATNIVFIGPTGVGKSGLATGLMLKALLNGYRALFIKAQDLFDDLYASLADRSSRKLLDRLARVPLPLYRRNGLSHPAARAEQHLLQAHGGAIPSPRVDHHDQPRLR